MNVRAAVVSAAQFYRSAVKWSLLAVLGTCVVADGLASASPSQAAAATTKPANTAVSLAAPQGTIPVAFLISNGAVMIDFTGPWEVFQDVDVPARQDPPFRLYTVAENKTPITASGGMKIVPDYTFESAPAPKVIVIPAQSEPTKAMLEWLRKSATSADVTMSVCTGAFVLARTGLLSGKAATTHHSGFRAFAVQFPDIRLKRGARFVDEGSVATAGGLSSGIDLALHVVERYFGRDVAGKTAYQMEYQGTGWMNPDSNELYAQERSSTKEHPLCAVCEMEVDPATAPTSSYKGKKYYFCSAADKAQFDVAPEKFVAAEKKP
jgi:transcriptional regulator GlxA family with amidase domain